MAAPSVTLLDPIDRSGFQIPIHLVVSADDQSFVDLTVEYSVDGGPFQEIQFFAPSSDSRTGLVAVKVGLDYRLIWDFGNELTQQSANLRLKVTPKSGAETGAAVISAPFQVSIVPASAPPAEHPAEDLSHLDIEVVQGNNQMVIAGQTLFRQLIARVTTPAGQPLPDVEVSFDILATSGVDAKILDFPHEIPATDHDGKVVAQVRVAPGSQGTFRAIATIVGVPDVQATFNLQAVRPKLKLDNPPASIPYGERTLLYVTFDVQAAPGWDLGYGTDSENPFVFKAEARNAEIGWTVRRIWNGSTIPLWIIPAEPGGKPNQASIASCNLKVNMVSDPSADGIDIDIPIETKDNFSYTSGILTDQDGYFDTYTTTERRLHLEVVKGWDRDPVEPTKLNQPRVFPGLTCAQPFQVRLIDEADNPWHETTSLNSMLVDCNQTVATGRQPLKIRWFAEGGVVSTTMSRGTDAELITSVDQEVFFTPTGPLPWVLVAHVDLENDTRRIYNQDSQSLNFKERNPSGGADMFYCRQQFALGYEPVFKTFLFHEPGTVRFEEATTAPPGAPGDRPKNLRPGDLVNVVVDGLSPFVGTPEPIGVKSSTDTFSDQPSFSGISLPYERDANFTAINDTFLRSQMIAIAGGTPFPASGDVIVGFPKSWLQISGFGIWGQAQFAHLARKRRMTTTANNGRCEAPQEAEVDTSASVGVEDSVLVGSGEFIWRTEDLAFASRSGQIRFSRTYRSHLTTDETYGLREPLGPGWVLEVAPFADICQNHTTLWNSDGLRRHFIRDREAVPLLVKPHSGNVFSDATPPESPFWLSDPQGGETHFNPDGTVRFFSDRLGNRIELIYNDTRQLVRVADPMNPSQRWMDLTYYAEGDLDSEGQPIADETWERLRAVTDFAGRTVTYDYYGPSAPNAGWLWRVRFPADDVYPSRPGASQPATQAVTGFRSEEVYHYEADPETDWRLVRIGATDADGQTRDIVENTYADSRVTVQKQTSGGSFRIEPEANNQIAVYDRSGAKTIFDFRPSPYNSALTATKIEEPDGLVTSVRSNRQGLVTRSASPDGINTILIYDSESPWVLSRGNLLSVRKETSGANAQVWTYGYDNSRNVMTRSVGPEGNQPGVDPTLHERIWTHDYQRGVGNFANVVDLWGPRRLVFTSEKQGDTMIRRWIMANPLRKMRYASDGRISALADERGVTTKFLYYPESDPSGSTQTTQAIEGGGGLLGKIIQDAEDSNRRNVHLPGVARTELTTLIRYDLLGKVIEVTDPSGAITAMPRNLSGIIKEMDVDQGGPASFKFKFGATPDGGFSQITAEGSADFDLFEFDTDRRPFRHVMSKSDPNGTGPTPTFEESLGWDSNSEVDEYHSTAAVGGTAPGAVARVSRRPNGTIETVSEFQSPEIVERYDRNVAGQLNKITFPGGQSANLTPGPLGQHEQMTTPLGATVQFARDFTGKIVGVAETAPSTDPDRDPNSFFAEFVRREDGAVARVHSAYLKTATTGSQTDAPIASPPESLGGQLPQSAMPRGTRAADAAGTGRQTYSLGRDIGGQVTRHVDPLGGETILRYDAHGRLIGTVDGAGRYVAGTWNDATRESRTTVRVRSEDPLNPGALDYFVERTQDALGRITRIVDQSGKTIRLTHSPDGLEVVLTDAMGTESASTVSGQPGSPKLNEPGNRTVVQHDAFGYPAEVEFLLTEDGIGGKPVDRSNAYNTEGVIRSSLEYDCDGRLLKAVSPTGGEFTIDYDDNGRPLTFMEPGQATQSVTYDDQGRIETMTDANGSVLRCHYSDGRLTDVTTDHAAPGVEPSGFSLGYDVDGNIKSFTNLPIPGQPAALEETFDWDSRGNLLSYVLDNEETRYETDAGGRITSLIYADGQTRRGYDYDLTGRLERVNNEAGQIAEFFYFGAERIGRVVSGEVTTTLGFDATGQPHQATYSGVDGGNITYEIDRDRMGRISEERRTHAGITDVHVFSRDSVGRIVREEFGVAGADRTIWEYLYDADSTLREIREFVDTGSGPPTLVATTIRDVDDMGAITEVTRTPAAPGPGLGPVVI